MFSLIDDLMFDLFDPDVGSLGVAGSPIYAFISMFILGLLFTGAEVLSYDNHDIFAIGLIGVCIVYVIAALVLFFKHELFRGLRGKLSLIYMLLSILVIFTY